MTISFSGKELINIAIGIERRGTVFYDIMSRSTENATAHDIFQQLADMEREHVNVFQSMLSEVAKYQLPETCNSEYAEYLQALVDSAVFTDEMATSEMATKIESDIGAVELAVGGEKDSILFYYGMKDIISQPAQATVDKIIAEEKSHLRQLSELKRRLSSD